MTIFSSFLIILGYQIVNLGIFSRIYAVHSGFEKEDKLLDFIASNISGAVFSG